MDYSRQEIFIGKKAQIQLKKAKVAIIGLGALGTVASELLVRSGVQNIILVDRDVVEISNLQRQTLFEQSDVNKPKALQAEKKLKTINTKVATESHFIHLDHENINKIKADLILDCTDNLETRFLLNEYAIKSNIPLIYGAAIRDKGYIFNVIKKPCLKCFLKDAETAETCETTGILNTTSNIIASLQVNEAIKIITKNNPERELLYCDLRNNTITKIKIAQNKDCSVCKGKYEYLNGKKTKISKFCDSFIFKENFDYQKVRSKLKKLGAQEYKETIIFKKITIFPKTVLIKTNSEKEAQSLYSKYIGN